MTSNASTNRIAVIDTETNWDNALMSVGIVIADGASLRPLNGIYCIITPEYERGGIFFDRLSLYEPTDVLLRHEAAAAFAAFLVENKVERIFAYNARFDFGLLPELSGFLWHDIMRAAAYRDLNPRIPPNADCYKTGRLKRNYGVEPMLRLLANDPNYVETHNAMLDALDELTIMRLLGHGIGAYECAQIN